MRGPEGEEGGDDLLGLVVFEGEFRAGVEGVEEVALFLEALGFDLGGEGRYANGVAAEGAGLDDALAVALEGGPIRVVRLGIAAVRWFCISGRLSWKRNLGSMPGCSRSTSV